MNILLTSVGRRNYLVEYFKSAVKPLNGKIFASNSDANAPGLYIADDYVISPLIYSENYESFLLEYCLGNKISIIISLFDIELPILSSFKANFKKNGIFIIVGDEWLTKMSNDKWETNKFLFNNDFLTRETYIKIEDCKIDIEKSLISFPLFIKPRRGMGSISVFRADNLKELEFYFELVKKEILNSYIKFESNLDIDNSVIIQPAFLGEEFGLDIINDLEGNYCTTIVKRKLSMRSGETDVAEIVEEPILESLGKKLSLLTKHPANLDVDVFFDGQKAFILDLNPRFGGGYPFSYEAGVDLPKLIVHWFKNGKSSELDILKYLRPKIGLVSMKGILMITK